MHSKQEAVYRLSILIIGREWCSLPDREETAVVNLCVVPLQSKEEIYRSMRLDIG